MFKAKHLFFGAAACLGLMAFSSFSLKNPSGEQVVRKMHDAWKGKWYENFSFEQKAIFYKNNAVVKEEVWQEIMSCPGKLHLRFNGFDTGNGAVYSRDSVYHFKEGKLQQKSRETNYLLLMGFDVYFNSPERTIEKLHELGFDLSKTHQTKWKGRQVTVVGTADAADLSSTQFWVDSKHNYVLRMIKNNQGKVRDIEFGDYRKVENHWIATEMIFKNGTETVFVEKYFNMKFPAKVDSALFDPARFESARWN